MIKFFKKNLKYIFLFILLIFIMLLLYVFLINKVDYEKLKKSVVMVMVYDNNNQLISTGSGVVAFEDDIIITNAHVIEDNYKIDIISENNKKYSVKGILAYNKKKDLAILKLNSSVGLKKVKIGKNAKIGTDIIAIGSPLGLKNTISKGIISGFYDHNIKMYQHTAPISHGSSGGALFNNKGELVGITCASVVEGQNLNFAIPIRQFENIYNNVKNNVLFDTRYYQYINNSILQTSNGYEIFNSYMKDCENNNEFPQINNKLVCGYDKECIEMKRIVSSYINLRLLIGGPININNIKTKNWSSYNYIIYKLSDKKYKNKVIEFVKSDIELLFGIDELKQYDVFSSDDYVVAYSCYNYDQCDSVAKRIKRFLNR